MVLVASQRGSRHSPLPECTVCQGLERCRASRSSHWHRTARKGLHPVMPAVFPCVPPVTRLGPPSNAPIRPALLDAASAPGESRTSNPESLAPTLHPAPWRLRAEAPCPRMQGSRWGASFCRHPSGCTHAAPAARGSGHQTSLGRAASGGFPPPAAHYGAVVKARGTESVKKPLLALGPSAARSSRLNSSKNPSLDAMASTEANCPCVATLQR